MTSQAWTDRLQAASRQAFLVGGLALAVSLLGVALAPTQFFRSYLFAFLFWAAIPLGSFGFVCLHNMSGGAWGFVIRRILESAAGTIPVVAVMFLPIVLGLEALYPWANAELVAESELLQHKATYLNVPFFLARAALYFALWIGASALVIRWSAQQDEGSEPRPRLTRRLQLLSGAGLPLYALTVSFAAIDWGMTLEPEWFSTIYGMLFVAGQGLSTLAFAIIVLAAASRYEPMSRVVRPSYFQDLGSLTLAFVMLWAYLSFSQYLIIWSGNLPEEISWYLHRSSGGWEFFAPVLIAAHFALPFLLLLSRRRKQSATALPRVAAWILGLRLIDMFWLVAPAFHRGQLSVHWLDLTLVLALGGIWLGFFLRRLAGWPMLPANDPRLDEALGAAEAH